jgi:L-lactate utilization protein LutC
VKLQQTVKHDQVMNEFKEQCAQVRVELEQQYKQKLHNKMDKFRQEYTNKREREIKLEIDYAIE